MSTTFLSLLPDDASFVRELPAPPDGVRLLAEADLHLTLAFLGRCSEEAGERAWQRALELLEGEAGASCRGGLAISLGQVIPLGKDTTRYSALSASLDEGRQAAHDLIAAIRPDALAAAGAPADPFGITPHLTLARPARDASPAVRAAGKAWADGLALTGTPLRLTRLALMTGASRDADRRYRELRLRAL